MKRYEKVIEKLLLGSSLLTVLTTAGIIYVLLAETVQFFSEVSIVDFLTDTQWTPQFAGGHFGIMPLLSGTLLTTLIAISVAVPLGLVVSVYLSEYAHKTFRNIIKPTLEILAAVPTVVYGYFALVYLTPLLKSFNPDLGTFNALSAGIMMGVMILPLVTSLSEDALFAVPKTMREGSYAVGATKFQTAWKVVVPSAISGIAVSVILAISRAIGETMIVAIAAGQRANLTFNPAEQVLTATSYIVGVTKGDAATASLEYRTIFAVGATLFVFTLVLNNLSYWLKKKFHQAYL